MVGKVNSKVSFEDMNQMVELDNFRSERMNEIDIQIEKLREERIHLKKTLGRGQLALKFDISESHASNILNGRFGEK